MVRHELLEKENAGITKLQDILHEYAAELSKELGSVHPPSWYIDRARYGALPSSVQPERSVTTWNAMMHMEKKVNDKALLRILEFFVLLCFNFASRRLNC